MTYTVKAGDTLYGISKQFGLSVSELMNINNLNNTFLSVGQKLIVSNDSNLYSVQKGDTLYSISKKYNIPISDLMELNNLTNNILNIGDNLIISNDSNKNSYIVQKGDTLYSIGKKFGVSIDSLVLNNNLSNYNLSVGQKLIINSENNLDDIPIGSSCYGRNYKEIEYITYTVKKGDNLYSIGKKYGVGVDEIIRLNNLNSNSLSIGQVLKIKEVI